MKKLIAIMCFFSIFAVNLYANDELRVPGSNIIYYTYSDYNDYVKTREQWVDGKMQPFNPDVVRLPDNDANYIFSRVPIGTIVSASIGGYLYFYVVVKGGIVFMNAWR
jgi:hypothetical protein